MAPRVKLENIIDGLEFQSDESASYLNRQTGEVVGITDDQIRAAEDDEPIEDFPEWEQELIQVAKEIVQETGKYIPLPTRFDTDEYDMMERFCLSLDDAELRETLYSLIKGSGAFRRFKDAIHEHGVADDWYKYRDNALREIAIEWCREHGIKFDEE
jgi:DNA polymerase III alpha subunit (gram-positive type)